MRPKLSDIMKTSLYKFGLKGTITRKTPLEIIYNILRSLQIKCVAHNTGTKRAHEASPRSWQRYRPRIHYRIFRC